MKCVQPLEGQLSKYTNVVKGWQYRYFVINPETGTLEYYVNDEFKKNRPRGSIHLEGAVISPSDEDSQTFTVNSVSGDVYKLRATNAKERQLWVNRLRSVAEYHTQVIAQNNPPLLPREHRSSTTPPPVQSQQEQQASLIRAQQRVMFSTATLYDAFNSAREVLAQAQYNHLSLAKAIEDLPSTGLNIKCLDQDMLLLKATSQATLVCMEQCLSILQQQNQSHAIHTPVVTTSAAGEPDETKSQLIKLNPSPTALACVTTLQQAKLPLVETANRLADMNAIAEDEVTDQEEDSDTDLGTVEEHKSIILHLLSQLKLGMDLTRVVLPTFILERRSLLEMFADFMGHPDLFLNIAEQSTPEKRMLAMVEWYLTSFHIGRKGAIAKKPYNPIIGEVFTCSWKVSRNFPSTSTSKTDEKVRIRYLAEQVSHHPPVSAFHVETADKKMIVNAHIWTKSKFMGTSIGVNMIGEVVLFLPEYDEEYVFQLPSAFARSILTVPWVELGGKISVVCSKSNYSAGITFHTKPFYGGKLHKVTAEVKNPQNTIICKVQGEWNGNLEFSRGEGDTKTISTGILPVHKKLVRPISKQNPIESRRLWQHVTVALRDGNIDNATRHKKLLEDRQRAEERQRLDAKVIFQPKYFSPKGNGWVYR